MITYVTIGIGFLIALAVIVGIVDAAQAQRWRRVAADRRARWEARQPQYHGVEYDQDDEEDDD